MQNNVRVGWYPLFLNIFTALGICFITKHSSKAVKTVEKCDLWSMWKVIDYIIFPNMSTCEWIKGLISEFSSENYSNHERAIFIYHAPHL